MWELDYEESWAPKNWCFWTVVLKTLESPLDCKEIQPVHPKGDQSWGFIGRTYIEAETPILWPPDAKSWLIGKNPDAGKYWGQEEGMTEDEMVGWHHWLDGHESEWTPGVGDGQGGLVCCSSWARRVGHDGVTEPNWMERMVIILTDYEAWVGSENLNPDTFSYTIKWLATLNLFKALSYLLIHVILTTNLRISQCVHYCSYSANGQRGPQQGTRTYQSLSGKVTEPALEPRAAHACKSLMGKAKNLLPIFLPKYPSTYVVNTMQRWANSPVTSKSCLLNVQLLKSRVSFLSLSNSLTIFLL